MSRFLCLIAFVGVNGPLCAEGPPSVSELVKQLSDSKYARREAAQRELIRLGDGIVPELDRLAKTADAETAERLKKVRFELVGFLDEMKQRLPRFDPVLDSVPRQISSELRDLITGHQPRAGDYLLDCISNPKDRLHRAAQRAFVQTWESASASQIDRFIQLQVYLTTEHRLKFPAKVAAMISMEAKIREGWGGWFSIEGDKQFVMKTRTTRFLDGKPYDKPFEYRHPFATVGWFRVGELAEGMHTIYAVLAYEFTHKGVKRTGEIRSKESQFEVVSAATPDDLIAPRSVEQFKRVKTTIELVRPLPPHEIEIGFRMPDPRLAKQEEVHVSWDVSPGKRAGLSCPRWDIRTPLDIDLCFDIEIHDVKTGKVYPADPIVLHKGEPGRGYLMPRDVRAFAGDRDGIVAIKVVRTPSRARALSDPKITSYFPETIATDDLQIKVFKELPKLDTRSLAK